MAFINFLKTNGVKVHVKAFMYSCKVLIAFGVWLGHTIFKSAILWGNDRILRKTSCIGLT